MASALAGNDPVIFFESQGLYSQTEVLRDSGVPEDYYRIPIGKPRLVRTGDDVTVLSVGATLYRVLEAAETLGAEGIGVEVIDARSLVPFDITTVVESVDRTGRLVCVSDAVTQGSYLATMAHDVSSRVFHSLVAPIVIVGTPNTIVPPADLTSEYFPSALRLAETIRELVKGSAGVDSEQPLGGPVRN